MPGCTLASSMSSPIFYIKVLERRDDVLRLRISSVEGGGFDVGDERDVLKAIGYGGDFVFPDGRVDYCWEDQSRIAQSLDFESELWNDEWLKANARRYYREAKALTEVRPAAVESPGHGHATPEQFFACPSCPYGVVEITVTDPTYIEHLVTGMVYSFY